MGQVESQSNLHDESILLEEPRTFTKELTKAGTLDSTNVSASVVAAATLSKILAYTQILEPTMDPVISRSLVTYW